MKRGGLFDGGFMKGLQVFCSVLRQVLLFHLHSVSFAFICFFFCTALENPYVSRFQKVKLPNLLDIEKRVFEGCNFGDLENGHAFISSNSCG